MAWEPMGRALFRIARAAHHGWGRFRLIEELGIPREEEYARRTYGFAPEDARYWARFLALMWMASYLGRENAPCEEGMREKASFERQPDEEWENEHGRKWARASGNNPQAKKLMPLIDEDVLPPRWRRKRKRVWVAETPLGAVAYEWSIELRTDTEPDVSLWLGEDPAIPRKHLEPSRLFSIAPPRYWLLFDDLEDYGRRYRAFLALLNAFIDELRELGERYLATGNLD